MKSVRSPFILFVLGFGIFMFTRRSELVPTIAVAILIAPVFILRFIRILSVKKGILYTLLGFLLSVNIALWGLFDIDDQLTGAIYSLVRSSLIAILYTLPFAFDRIIHPYFKGSGLLSTLSYPVITTAIFFLSSLEGPFDGTGMSSKFVDGFVFLPVKQALAFAGVWILVFLASWIASISNHWWEEKAHWAKVKHSTYLFIIAVLGILVSGLVRTAKLKNESLDRVKVAAIVLIPEDGKSRSMENLWTQRAYSPYPETIARIETLTKSAAAHQAKIISFQEHAITIDRKDEDQLIRDYQRIAQENEVYLSITYSYYSKTEKGENKHLLIDPEGEVVLDYSKRYLLGLGPFGETAIFNKGPEIIQSTETPYGVLAISTCRDMDFPRFIRQAGRDGIDIMLSPSYDWPKSTGPSYLLRTIENGFSFIRPTYNGITYAADYSGKVLASMDSEQSESGIMFVDVPTEGVRTIYSQIGELFGWLTLLGALLFIIVAIRRKRSHR